MIFNMVGGGAGGAGGGATLVVSSPANVSVTVSKDDKSYTKNSGSLGSTTFKGLATGTWTVTISGNGQTATKTIEITADYAITIAFFSASINITYPATSTCVVTNSSGQTVASNSNTGSSTKTWTATVSATGTYTVTATSTIDSSKTKSATVNITTDGQNESVNLFYIPHLYRAGDQDTGFVPIGWAHESGGYKGEPTIKYNTNSVVFTSQSPSGWGGSSGVVYFPNKIDLTDLTTLRANATLKGELNPDNRPEGLYIWKEVGTGYYVDKAVARALFNGAGTKTLSINVSNLSGEYYIGFGLRYEGSPNETITLMEATLE